MLQGIYNKTVQVPYLDNLLDSVAKVVLCLLFSRLFTRILLRDFLGN